MNWKGFGQQYCLITKYFPSICLGELKKKNTHTHTHTETFF